MTESDIRGVSVGTGSRRQEAASRTTRGPEEHATNSEAYSAKGLTLCEYRTDGRRLVCPFHRKKSGISFCAKGSEPCPLEIKPS